MEDRRPQTYIYKYGVYKNRLYILTLRQLCFSRISPSESLTSTAVTRPLDLFSLPSDMMQNRSYHQLSLRQRHLVPRGVQRGRWTVRETERRTLLFLHGRDAAR